MSTTRTQRVFLMVTFLIYCFIYPSSLYLLMTDSVPPHTEWMASFMLILQGLTATAWVVTNYSWWRGWLAALTLLSGGWLVEQIGVMTGLPFGPYYYTDVLSPKVGVVPLGILCAWLMLMIASFFTARFLVERLWPQAGLRALLPLSAALAVLSDFLMEPVAVHIQGYWVWTGSDNYYGVPWSNFIAWAVISGLMGLALVLILGDLKTPVLTPSRYNYGWLPLTLFHMNLIMFAAINLTHAYYWAVVIGVILVALDLYLIYRASFTTAILKVVSNF